MSVYESSCSSLWTLGWLHHRLRSCWKFPKLLFPLCRLCDLHFPGLSVRFVTGYLLPPRMTNLLLRVLVGNTTSECKGKKDWELKDQAEERNANETCVNSCLCECVFCINKSHIIFYRKEAIITGDALLITCKHVQTHMDTHTKVSRAHHYSSSHGALLQDRLLVMRLLSIDHSGSSRCFILVIATWMWGSWENCMMKNNCIIFWHFSISVNRQSSVQ